MPQENWPGIAKAVESELYGYQQLLQEDRPDSWLQWVDSIVKRVQREGRWSPARQCRGKSSSPNQSPETEKVTKIQNVIDGVLIDKVSHTHTTSLGPTLLGLKVWENLVGSEP